jgi:hypothetical protein
LPALSSLFCQNVHGFSFFHVTSGAEKLINIVGILRLCSLTWTHTFKANNGAAVTMDLASDATFAAPTFAGNVRNRVVVDAGTLPASLSLDSPDIVYTFAGDVTIPQGLTLTKERWEGEQLPRKLLWRWCLVSS